MRGGRLVAAGVIVLASAGTGARIAADHVIVSIPVRHANVLIGCDLVERHGTLHGDRWASPHVWLDLPGNPHVEVEWPAGFSARFTPGLELLDASGRVFARDGDEIAYSGAGAADTSCGVYVTGSR